MLCNNYMRVGLLLLFGLVAYPQGASVRLSEQPADLGSQVINVFSGTSLTYRCIAPSRSTTLNTITVSTVSNANPGSMTATTHGFDYQSGATITLLAFISGFTGGWTGLNGTHVLTPSSANALTTDVDTSGFGAFGAQTPTITTRAVKTTSLAWAIKAFVYDVSGNNIWSGWAAGAKDANSTNDGPLGGQTQYNFACASRTTYAYQ